MLAPLRTAFLALALASTGTAQIIVNTGDDLSAIVAAAPDGSVIEIHSDATFVGTLQWTDKSLTVRAGNGYSPTVKGDPGFWVVIVPALLHGPTDVTGATFEGLNLVSGFTTPVVDPLSIRIRADDSQVTTASFVDCLLPGYLTLRSDETGTLDVGVYESENSRLQVDADETSLLLLTLEDSLFTGNGIGSSHDDAHLAVEARRSRFLGYTSRTYDDSTGDVLFDSCLFEGTAGSSGTGAYVGGTSAAHVRRFVNCTFVGHHIAIYSGGDFTAENLLLAGNTYDVDQQFPPGLIAHSFLESGQFDGLDGNFTGSVCLDANFALLPGSAGIDAGLSFVPGMGITDLYGDPRVQDGDGDFIAQVNVGAVEGVGAGSPASATVANGNGVNPLLFSALTPPILGSVFKTQVSLAGMTTPFTFVSYDSPAAVPFTIPGFQGEFLLALSGALFTDSMSVAPGTHHLPLPYACGLVGLTYRCQGARLELTGVQLTNALDLVFGTN